ncbi:hypothetical protein I533_16595 [Alteromonas mediterranea MED64]|uniref:hypothetical protein n=1 Tax=Alteromonas mediterranea TaxID=314275 RepID=UPI00035577A0|nr:hypothetical protein [Alteromonas mediterranea]AGP83270.1 hypothetical protein I533_16595 [Alteromonas mediterranea MED64]
MNHKVNIIFFPGQRYFVLPIILIYKYYQEQDLPVIVVCEKAKQSMFSEYGFTDLVECAKNYLSSGNRNLVFFQHNTPGSFNAVKKVLEDIVEFDGIELSLMPDGLGNSMYGESLIDEASKRFEHHFSLNEVFSFGFVHSTVANRFESEKITCLPIKPLFELFENVMQKHSFAKLKTELDSFQNIMLIPYRPWCTKDFHGGVYDIGNAENLAKIYDDLIERLKKHYNLDNVIILFRGDGRYEADSASVYDNLTLKNKINLVDYLPEEITLEPVIYSILNKCNADFQMITLDSTTFQSVPLMCSHIANVNAIGSIGCTKDLLEFSERGSHFFTSKLNGKINDFFYRFQSINSITKNINISSRSEGHFYVEVN